MKITYPEFGITIEPGRGRDTTADSVRCKLESGAECVVEPSLVHQPDVSCCSATLGIKSSGKPDFTVVKLARPGAAAGVFTRNRCPSVTVLRNRRCLADGRAQLLAVNSGNANVFTPTGEADVNETAALLASEFSVTAEDVLVCSTGVIGVPLPMEKFRAGIPGLSRTLRSGNLDAAAEAILTTDLGPKTASLRHGDLIISGIAKGAGMIEPNLATMLVYLFTNAALSPDALRRALGDAAAHSFNSISVDSDTSTSDSVVLFTTGDLSPAAVAESDFGALLRSLCIKLGRDIVSQGEGVTKIIEAAVESSVSYDYSHRLAKQIVNSPLFKCAVHGADPNWGRIVMAIGKGGSPGDPDLIDPASLEIELQDVPVYRRGEAVAIDKQALREKMLERRVVAVRVKIGGSKFIARAWGCDLSKEYVSINADYTT